MKKPLHMLLATACILALAGCEGVNIPGAYSQAPVTQQAAEAQSGNTVDAPRTIAPPSDTAVSDLTVPDAPSAPAESAPAEPAPAEPAPAEPAPAEPAPAEPAPAEPAPAPQPPALTAPDTAGDIGDEKAREIALSHAGLSEKDVTFIKSHPDFDDGRFVYDVEFYKDMTEYDYEIDAASGNILSFDFDVEGYAIAPPAQPAAPQAPAQPAPAEPAPAPQQQQQATGNITLDQAKSIALQHAGVSNATFTKAHMDYDDGYAIYEIDFISGTMEYDVEVDARTGAVLEFDAESVYDD